MGKIYDWISSNVRMLFTRRGRAVLRDLIEEEKEQFRRYDEGTYFQGNRTGPAEVLKKNDPRRLRFIADRVAQNKGRSQ